MGCLSCTSCANHAKLVNSIYPTAPTSSDANSNELSKLKFYCRSKPMKLPKVAAALIAHNDRDVYRLRKGWIRITCLVSQFLVSECNQHLNLYVDAVLRIIAAIITAPQLADVVPDATEVFVNLVSRYDFRSKIDNDSRSQLNLVILRFATFASAPKSTKVVQGSAQANVPGSMTSQGTQTTATTTADIHVGGRLADEESKLRLCGLKAIRSLVEHPDFVTSKNSLSTVESYLPAVMANIKASAALGAAVPSRLKYTPQFPADFVETPASGSAPTPKDEKPVASKPVVTIDKSSTRLEASGKSKSTRSLQSKRMASPTRAPPPPPTVKPIEEKSNENETPEAKKETSNPEVVNPEPTIATPATNNSSPKESMDKNEDDTSNEALQTIAIGILGSYFSHCDPDSLQIGFKSMLNSLEVNGDWYDSNVARDIIQCVTASTPPQNRHYILTMLIDLLENESITRDPNSENAVVQTLIFLMNWGRDAVAISVMELLETLTSHLYKNRVALDKAVENITPLRKLHVSLMKAIGTLALHIAYPDQANDIYAFLIGKMQLPSLSTSSDPMAQGELIHTDSAIDKDLDLHLLRDVIIECLIEIVNMRFSEIDAHKNKTKRYSISRQPVPASMLTPLLDIWAASTKLGVKVNRFICSILRVEVSDTSVLPLPKVNSQFRQQLFDHMFKLISPVTKNNGELNIQPSTVRRDLEPASLAVAGSMLSALISRYGMEQLTDSVPFIICLEDILSVENERLSTCLKNSIVTLIALYLQEASSQLRLNGLKDFTQKKIEELKNQKLFSPYVTLEINDVEPFVGTTFNEPPSSGTTCGSANYSEYCDLTTLSKNLTNVRFTRDDIIESITANGYKLTKRQLSSVNDEYIPGKSRTQGGIIGGPVSNMSYLNLQALGALPKSPSVEQSGNETSSNQHSLSASATASGSHPTYAAVVAGSNPPGVLSKQQSSIGEHNKEYSEQQSLQISVVPPTGENGSVTNGLSGSSSAMGISARVNGNQEKSVPNTHGKLQSSTSFVSAGSAVKSPVPRANDLAKILNGDFENDDDTDSIEMVPLSPDSSKTGLTDFLENIKSMDSIPRVGL